VDLFNLGSRNDESISGEPTVPTNNKIMCY
jgi:hypothetical protein